MRDWYTPEEEFDFQREERSLGRFVRNVLFGVAFLVLCLGTLAQAVFSLK